MNFLAALLLAQAEQALKPVSGHVTAVAFSPDGRWLAAAGKEVALLDTQKWEVRILGLHGHYVEGIAFSPDGKTLATGGWDREIKLWQVETGQELAALKGHPDALAVLAYSAGGDLLASGDWSGTVKVWDGAAGREIGSIRGHDRGVGALAWDREGKKLAAASWDGAIRRYHVGRSFKPVDETRLEVTGCHFIALSPDGRRTLTGAGQGQMYELKCFDAASGKLLRTFKSHSFSLRRAVYSADASRVATIAGTGPMLKIWNAESGVLMQELEGGPGFQRVHSVAFSPGGDRVAVGSDGGQLRVFRSK
jgi:WD40 repeat protein